MCISAAIFEYEDEEDYQQSTQQVNPNWDKFYL